MLREGANTVLQPSAGFAEEGESLHIGLSGLMHTARGGSSGYIAYLPGTWGNQGPDSSRVHNVPRDFRITKTGGVWIQF